MPSRPKEKLSGISHGTLGTQLEVHPCTWVTSIPKELLASRQLLRDHASSGDHGQAAVVDLLCLHLLELCGICGLEAKWVEAEVPWLAIGFHRPRFATPEFATRLFKAEDCINLRDGNC